ATPTGPPPPTGPCGYNPDAENPPGPFFTITTKDVGISDGTVQVGAAHGSGDFSGTNPQDLPFAPYKAVGEILESFWSRATESSVMLYAGTNGLTQTP